MVWWQTLLNLLTMFISLLFLSITTYKSIGKKLTITYYNISTIIIFALLVSISNKLFPQKIMLFGNYIIEIIMFKILNKNQISEKIFYFTIIVIFGAVIELIVTLFFYYILGFSNLFNVALGLQLIMVVIIYAIWFGGWNFIIKIKRLKNGLEIIRKNISKMMSFELLFIVIFIALNIVYVNCYEQLKNYSLGIVFLILIGIIFIATIKLLKSKYEKDFFKKMNESMEKTIKIYEKIAEDYKIMKHNLNADFMIIKSLCPNEVQPLINSKIANYQQNYEWINNINNIPDGIKGLMFLKMEKAKKHKVHVIIESENLSKIIKIKKPKLYLDLCETLEILLENAIEAAEVSQNKIVKIIITKSNNIKIKILNTFSNSIDLEKIGNMNYSTKNRNSGVGLYFLKRKENQKIKILNEIVNDLYITTILLNL